MPNKVPRRVLIVASALAFALAFAAACERNLADLDPATFPAEPAVFIDEFGPGVTYAAFAGSKVDALDIEHDEVHQGTAALRLAIPAPTDPSGGFAGGAFVSAMPRDLSGFDALTFWARSSTAATLNTVGIGNDNTGGSRYPAEVAGLPLSTRWTKYAIPLPLPAVLTEERGLFLVAEGSEYAVGYDVYFDDVQFETLGTITRPRPAIATATVVGEAGRTLAVGSATVTFDVAGADVTVNVAPAYFTYTSSDPEVARVAPDGSITLVRPGAATITAALGQVPASGAVTVRVETPPEGAPPAPTAPAAKVISLFSDAYDDVRVDTWSADWDVADVEDVVIAGNPVKRYSNLGFAGIEFASSPLDASAMTHLHIDIWAADAAAFRVKLVDFGGDGAYQGGDDSESEVTLGPTSNPNIESGRWSSLHIPLDAFGQLASRSSLAQLIFSGDISTVYVDNIYFVAGETTTPTGPAEPAPTPSDPADQVISLFSDAYQDVQVDTWSAEWDVADLADVDVRGDAVKRYANLVYAGIEFTSQTIDAGAMTHFRMDVWTPDATAAAAFKVKLVDFGANGVYDGQGAGDDSEHEVEIRASDGLATGEWVRLDLPLASFTGLAGRRNLAQIVLSGDLGTVYVDNVYFRR